MLGLGSSLVHSNVTEESGLVWAGTKFLNLPGGNGDFARVQNFSNFLGRISGAGTDDIADTITLSFWVKPLWVMGNVGTNQHVESNPGLGGSGNKNNNVALPVFGNTTTEKDRIRVVYIIDTSTGSDRNRIMIQAMDASNNQERDETFLHDANNSITGLGSGLTNTGVSSGWWHNGNKGNTNSDDFVHLAFTRSSGNWNIYWNGQALGSMIDADSGSLGFDEGNVDEFWLGKSFANQDHFKMGYRDIAYFNAELSASEVAALYNSGNLFDVRTHSQAANLGLYWPCQDVQELSGAGAAANLDLQGNCSFEDI